jgi:hypothetical protein
MKRLLEDLTEAAVQSAVNKYFSGSNQSWSFPQQVVYDYLGITAEQFDRAVRERSKAAINRQVAKSSGRLK